MEERFIAQLTPSAANPAAGTFERYAYQNRFRYRVWMTVPLGPHQLVEPGVWSFHLYDEVFLNFGNDRQLDFIQQNRIAGMIGYQVSKPFAMQLGYLCQTIQRPGAANGTDLVELNSTIHLALVYSTDLSRPRSTKQPE